MRDAAIRSGNSNLEQQYGAQQEQAQQGLELEQYGQALNLANESAPTLTQTGSSGTSSSSGTGSQVQSQSPLGQIATGGADIGSSLIMAF